jgi:phosphatidylserine/phosphatidylglycerophosphate/cardiolipin synthase-like enzyme
VGDRVTGLDALERRYLRAGADLPIHREDSGWEPLIDGERYLPALDAEIRAAGPGDAVYLSAFQLGPDTDLRGRAADDPDFEPVAELLSRKAAEGVDVRLIIAGGAPGSLPVRGLGPFRDNLVAVRRLRRWTPAGLRRRHHPLARRILLDWSGHPIGANHQKFVVVRRGDAVVAFVGGMDIDRWRFDGEPHDRLRVSGRRWGWHDAAQRVTGAAAERVWEVFRARWQEATSLPRRLYWLPPDRPRLVNPRTHLPAPEAAPAGEPRPTAGKSLQVARSFGPWKRALGLSLLPRRWRVLPATGVSEIFDVLTHAVDASSAPSPRCAERSSAA